MGAPQIGTDDGRDAGAAGRGERPAVAAWPLLAGLAAAVGLSAAGAPQAGAALGAAALGAAATLRFAPGWSGTAWRRAGAVRGRADPRARAFAALHRADPAPRLLTDRRGAALAANPAASAGTAPTRAEALADPDPEAAAAVYRMLRGVRRHGRAAEAGLRRNGRPGVLRAEALGDDLVVWRWDVAAAPADLAAALDALDLPALLTAPDGSLRPNAAAARGGDGAADEPAALAAALGRPAVALPQGAGWLFPDAGAGSGAASGLGGDLIDALPVALARLDLDGVLTAANAPALRLLGDDARPGAALEALVEGLGRSMAERVIEAARGRATGRAEMARGRREDRETFLQISLSRVDLDGEPGLIAVLADATELKTLEAQFVQSQKMQAVGQLAGGVAHDFNNLLTAILGHCDLMLMRRDAADADQADLVQIRQNANRAAALVRQMLAFSRKQTLRPTVVNLGGVLEDLAHMLGRLMGEKVRLRLDHAADLWPVRVDARQFEQVVMNLAVNARDAMPAGGEVRIRAANVTLTELRRDRAVVPPGDYVAVTVTDQGHGILPDRIGHIFEPFYTTKKTGEGTGLGLSTAYGIVKQTGGFIFADSPPGSGAVFTVYLPRHLAGSEPAAPPTPAVAPAVEAAAAAADGGTVLLVEDETPVRSFAARALGLRGYQVHEAESAEAALALLEDPAFHPDVIVSDVVMPGLDGPTWVKTARERRPDLAVVFVSGYAEDVFRRRVDGLGDVHFLAKPYSLADLTAAIRAVRAAVPEAATLPVASG